MTPEASSKLALLDEMVEIFSKAEREQRTLTSAEAERYTLLGQRFRRLMADAVKSGRHLMNFGD